MEIRKISFWDLSNEMYKAKPELYDTHAFYIGAFDGTRLVAIAGWQVHKSYIYCCHDFTLPEYRGLGIYERLFDCRLNFAKTYKRTIIAHCTDASLKTFKKNGFEEEFKLTKVVLGIKAE